jgi:hypothetical protein
MTVTWIAALLRMSYLTHPCVPYGMMLALIAGQYMSTVLRRRCQMSVQQVQQTTENNLCEPIVYQVSGSIIIRSCTWSTTSPASSLHPTMYSPSPAGSLAR